MKPGQYIILKLSEEGVIDHMRDLDGNMKYYSDLEEAQNACWIYELDEGWIVKLVEQYKEES